MKNIEFTQFREDSYLKQLDRDTNLILWFIAIVFGLFGLLSYASFNRRVEILEKELTEKYDNTIQELNAFKQELNDVRIDIESESAEINSQIAESFYQEKEYDFYVFYKLLSLSKSARYYLHNIENETVNDTLLKSIIADLEYFEICLTGLEEKPKILEEDFINFTSNIREIQDFKVIGLLSEIYGLIKFKKE